jgi:UDP-N-acetyl-D-glucosamine dehydrogenase
MYSKSYYKVAIIGLGYVGLPLYILINKKKIHVRGFDIDQKKIKLLKRNISTNSDVKNYELARIKNKNFFNINDCKLIKDCNIIIFCLPTPLTKKNHPDLSFIKNAFNKIKKFISTDTLLVLESTVYPGATKEIFENYIKNNFDLKSKVNFGFSSERICPGQIGPDYKIKYEDITKVISINNLNFRNKIENFYKMIFKKTYMTETIEVAEMSKLLENSYRSVNIGLINEMKLICMKSNIDIFKVIKAASTKPFGFTSFLPGPGVGGHCIPIDPVFVSWFAKRNNSKAEFIELARITNLNITKNISKKLIKILNTNTDHGNNKILIIGVAYKEEVNDYRESPAITIIKELIKNKYSFDFYDPFIKEIKIKSKIFKGTKSLDNINSYKVCALLTAHKKLPYKFILKKANLIVDTKGKFSELNNNKIINL